MFYFHSFLNVDKSLSLYILYTLHSSLFTLCCYFVLHDQLYKPLSCHPLRIGLHVLINIQNVSVTVDNQPLSLYNYMYKVRLSMSGMLLFCPIFQKNTTNNY